MGYKRHKRKWPGPWKAVKRCVLFFTTICVIPLLLVLLVTTDHYLRPLKHSFTRQENGIVDKFFYLKPRKEKMNQTVVIARLKNRQKHLYETCRALGLDKIGNDSLHRPNAWEFLVNDEHHLVWCNVFKAASTSWMYNFNLLAGYSPKFLKKTKAVPLSLARKKYSRPSPQALMDAMENSLSFLIVRHPLERLLSAYRDKLQYSLPHTYHRQLGNKIIIKYRKKEPARTTPNYRWPTFPEFVDFLLDCVKHNRPLDMHWTPITEFCTPCLFKFDVIAHTETLQEDQQYIIEKAHLENLIEPQWKNAGHGPTSKQVRKYYTKLTKTQIMKLYNLYRYDFQLFNYSMKGYLELGLPDEKFFEGDMKRVEELPSY
ncbi:carbohydrate sulfotransferase 11-like [Harmonia axyridis]|uniref:carbohydrate sulfotransferase 11-like n=1 Tax=Harmonia axyridis TaxID=115357 RepID=UPI001E275CA7|nr:carbohydrate sulfotransferase 11-like [Harmonia axyridis]